MKIYLFVEACPGQFGFGLIDAFYESSYPGLYPEFLQRSEGRQK